MPLRGGEAGCHGAVVAQPGSTTHVTEGISPVPVRDRTGAGDAAGSQTVSVLGAVGEVMAR